MKIEIYSKDEPHQVSHYEVHDLATTDLTSWPFEEGTELSFAEISTYIESINRQLQGQSQLSSPETQTKVIPVDVNVSGQPGESELDKQVQASADSGGTAKSAETETIDATLDSGRAEQNDLMKGQSDPNISGESQAESVDQRVQSDAEMNTTPILSKDQSQAESLPTDLREDVRLVRKVSAFLPRHVLRQLHRSRTFSSMDDPTATKLSVILLFEKVIEELRRNHRPPELYNVRIRE